MEKKRLSCVVFFVGIVWLTLIIFVGVFAIGVLIKYEMNQMRVAMEITVQNDHAAHGDAHGEEGWHGEGHGDSRVGGHGGFKEDDHGHGVEEVEATEQDDPNKPEPIVPEGENIIINPAGSGGARYLLVEIFLLRKDVQDKGFPLEVSKRTKQLQAVTVAHLSREDAQSLANSAVKARLKTELKKAYQEALGKDHPIKELIISKWIMQ
tara:strand:+ start:220 stop:843 length:624 start_codon:yes stop_codon:yes gene_type:complete